MVLYFDTETTGLYPGRIVQLSYILQDANRIIAKNFFFNVGYVPEDVVKVHGFTAEKLKVLSNGKVFEDHFEEINNDFLSAEVIAGHNVDFDIMFMRAEYERLGEVFKYKNTYCTMKKFTPFCKLLRSDGIRFKYPKLSELQKKLDIYDYDISVTMQKFFGEIAGAHDARFDTTAVCLFLNTDNDIAKDFRKKFIGNV